ncbi:thermonuclease family protein [Caenimonas sedimenti]|uniref:Thermonuclease family protein n=1 Tax=Caenimonas sedimenti TaxID=2596921 RepID=A0A562ZI81_9BURK|nr:thermonuclease family protein [Caenimonas sedimenti]TWO68292.1 thermonuclease family protein [Caenimonas sedimenti]
MVAIAWRLVLAAALLGGAGAHAGQFQGVVSHVTDGDSLWVRPADGAEPVEIRLLHLDAPEGCQAFGAQARAALARRVLHQKAIVRTRGQDDYGRTLARIQFQGEDLGAWLVRGGYAWSTGNRKSPGPYAAFEAQARDARQGLWAEPGAQRPRDFRRTHGRCQRG